MKKVLFVGAMILITSGQAAWGGDLITVSFTGTVTSITDPAGALSGFSLGDPVTGSYTYDLSLPDTNADPAVGHYTGSIPTNGMWIKVGATELGPDPIAALVVDVSDNQPVTHDTFGMNISVPAFPGCDGAGTWLVFRDTAESALSSDVLLTDAPSLTDFPLHYGLVLGFYCGPGQETSTLRFDVTSVTLTGIVSIPATGAWGIAVLAVGLVGGAVFALRRRQTHEEARIPNE